MSILDALTILFKRKVTIMVVFLAVVAVTIGITFLQKPVFETKSTLLVKLLKDDTPPSFSQSVSTFPQKWRADSL